MLSFFWASSLIGANVIVHPTNPIETVFTTIIMLFTVMAMAYIISIIGSIIKDIDRNKKIEQEDIEITN